MSAQTLDVCITAVGMASSLGLDAVTSCAAARAGLRRATDLSFHVINPETNDLEPASGCPIARLTDGFEGVGRLLRVMELGLADFRRSTDPAVLEAATCAWALAVPDPLPGSPSGSSSEEAPTEPAGMAYPAQQALQRFIYAEFGEAAVSVVREGHAGFAVALRTAMQNVASGAWARCVVGAADTLLDSNVLRSLQRQARLKGPDQPVGLSPGEAAAFFLLKPLAEARHRGERVLGTLSAVGIGMEREHQLTGKPGVGSGLAAAASDLAVGERSPWLISDHNGEEYRASEWGYTLMRLLDRYPVLQNATQTYPAASFGDTGTASGAVGLCLALHGFARRHAPASEALIFSSSDRGTRGVIAVSAPA